MMFITLVRRLEFSGIHKRSQAVHSFVIISVDGEQQAKTSRSVETLTSKWEPSKPLAMMARASSILKFAVYLEHIILSKVGGNGYLYGEVEIELQAVLTNPGIPIKLQGPWHTRGSLEICVYLDVESRFDPINQQRFQWAGDRHNIPRIIAPMRSIGFAVEDLNSLVGFVDGLVEIHSMCKIAWVALESVYETFKDSDVNVIDHQSLCLAEELKEVLAFAKGCRDLKTITEATDILFRIAKLVVQSAAAIDSVMKCSASERAVIRAAMRTNLVRVVDCEAQMRVLRMKLQEIVITRIFLDQMSTANESTPHTPFQERYRPRYSPFSMSTSIDEDCQPASQLSPITPFSSLEEDPCNSNESINPHGFIPSPILTQLDQNRDVPNCNAVSPSSCSLRSMSSRMSSFSSNSGRTQSRCSSRSSLFARMYSEAGEDGQNDDDEDDNSLFDSGSYSIQLSLS